MSDIFAQMLNNSFYRSLMLFITLSILSCLNIRFWVVPYFCLNLLLAGMSGRHIFFWTCRKIQNVGFFRFHVLLGCAISGYWRELGFLYARLLYRSHVFGNGSVWNYCKELVFKKKKFPKKKKNSKKNFFRKINAKRF